MPNSLSTSPVHGPTLQMKQDTMYKMRESIRRGRNVTEGYDEAKKKLHCPDEELQYLFDDPLSDKDLSGKDESLDALLDDALLARDLNLSLSLIGYAARWGRKDWFHHCLLRVRKKVRHDERF